VVISLGHTLGTYPPGILLGAVQHALQPNDLFIFDTHIRTDEGPYDGEERQRDRDIYSSDFYLAYIVAPLRTIGITDRDGFVSLVDYQDTIYERVPQIGHHFTFSKDVTIHCYGTEFRFIRGERIDLGYSLKFTMNILDRLLEVRGFSIEKTFVSSSESTALYICRKT
jgi:hypothetical protein